VGAARARGAGAGLLGAGPAAPPDGAAGRAHHAHARAGLDRPVRRRDGRSPGRDGGPGGRRAGARSPAAHPAGSRAPYLQAVPGPCPRSLVVQGRAELERRVQRLDRAGVPAAGEGPRNPGRGARAGAGRVRSVSRHRVRGRRRLDRGHRLLELRHDVRDRRGGAAARDLPRRAGSAGRSPSARYRCLSAGRGAGAAQPLRELRRRDRDAHPVGGRGQPAGGAHRRGRAARAVRRARRGRRHVRGRRADGSPDGPQVRLQLLFQAAHRPPLRGLVGLHAARPAAGAARLLPAGHGPDQVRGPDRGRQAGRLRDQVRPQRRAPQPHRYRHLHPQCGGRQPDPRSGARPVQQGVLPPAALPERVQQLVLSQRPAHRRPASGAGARVWRLPAVPRRHRGPRAARRAKICRSGLPPGV